MNNVFVQAYCREIRNNIRRRRWNRCFHLQCGSIPNILVTLVLVSKFSAAALNLHWLWARFWRTSKTNKPTSRAELKRQKQILKKDGVVKKNTAPAIAVKVETPESSTTSLSCYADQRAGASAADNRRRKSRQALSRPGSWPQRHMPRVLTWPKGWARLRN